MKCIPLLFFFLIFQNSYCQKGSLDKIIFRYDSSTIKKQLEIRLQKNKDSTYVSIFSGKFLLTNNIGRTTELNAKTFGMKNEIFNEILNQSSQINPFDLTKNGTFGRDGYSTTLKFESGLNSFSYQVYMLEMEDDKTELKEYLKTCLMLFEIAKINPKKYF